MPTTPTTVLAEHHPLPDGSTATVTVLDARSFALGRVLPDGREVWGQVFSTTPDDLDTCIADHLEGMEDDPDAYHRWWFR